MKKSIILFLIASVTLAACASKDSEETKTKPNDSKTETTVREDAKTTPPQTKTEDDQELNESKTVTETEDKQVSDGQQSQTETKPVTESPTTTVTETPKQTTQAQPKQPASTTPSIAKQYGNRTFTGKDGEGYTYSMNLTFKDEKSGFFTLTVIEDKTGQLSEKLTNVAFTLDNDLSGLFTYTADQTADKFDGGNGGIKLANNSVEFGRYRFSITLH